jgi:hypothetical protein
MACSGYPRVVQRVSEPFVGSEGSVPPFDGIPLVDAYGILGWLGHYCFLSRGDC